MRRLLLWGLCCLNLVLAALLLAWFGSQETRPSGTIAVSDLEADSAVEPPEPNPRVSFKRITPARPRTPFTTVYSSDLKQFAANLRRINCPEETIKDILTTAVHERYRAQEAALRPTPADHVPLTWPANTSERKLVERRLQAAALARAQSASLTEALGYTVSLAPPEYGLRDSDKKFEQVIAGLTPEQKRGARQTHEEYWQKVLELHDRAKGFWQSGDIAELEQLKARRQQALVAILGQQ